MGTINKEEESSVTDIEQLERDLEYFTELLLENRNEEIENEVPAGMYCEIDVPVPTLERVMEAARAHMETMRQEPFGFLHYEVADNEKGIKLHYEFSRHALTKSDKEAGWDEIKVYTTPPPAEQPVLKVPEIKYETLTGFDRGADAMRDKIIAMNPHLKVEES